MTAKKPVELARKQGNPGRRPLPELASVTTIPRVGIEAPEHLTPDRQQLWISIREVAFWISGTDESNLLLLCEKLDRRAELIAKLSTSDFVLYTDKGYAYANPLMGMLSTIENEITKQFSLLGLTPADRTRLGVGEVKARSVLDDLINSRKAKNAQKA